MKIEFVKPGAGYGFGYHPGEVADLDDEDAKKLMEANVAIPAKEGKPENGLSKGKPENGAKK